MIAARDRVEEDEIRAAFLHWLTSRRLDLRSALGSLRGRPPPRPPPARPGRLPLLHRLRAPPDAAAIRPQRHELRAPQVRRPSRPARLRRLRPQAVRARRPPGGDRRDRALLDACSTSSTSCPPARPRRRPPRANLRELKGNAQERAVLVDRRRRGEPGGGPLTRRDAEGAARGALLRWPKPPVSGRRASHLMASLSASLTSASAATFSRRARECKPPAAPFPQRAKKSPPSAPAASAGRRRGSARRPRPRGP